MRRAHAVVLGGGWAGMLAAGALSQRFSRVTVIEADTLPTGPRRRPGLPQARHGHLLWSGGARAVESLLPGTLDRWVAAGAHRIALPTDLVYLSAEGWMQRTEEFQYILTCGRDLLDWVVRRRVLADPAVTLHDGVRCTGLLGDASRVTGVRLGEGPLGSGRALRADLVVDSTGRGSRAPRWLAGLGLPEVRERQVDAGAAYASRVFRAPPGLDGAFPLITVQADPRSAGPGRTATLLPIEEGRWLVTLSGTRGGEPPTDGREFIDFARGVRHPVVGEFAALAEPAGPVYSSRSTGNRRRYFEDLSRWPDGLVILGDAVACFNPTYGHGMSVAARGACALRDALDSPGPAFGWSGRVQQAIADAASSAWRTATSQDIRYPGAVGPRPRLAVRMLQRYADRLVRTAGSRQIAAEALFEAYTLSGSFARLAAPRVVLSTLLGRAEPPTSEPPLTSAELAWLRPGRAPADRRPRGMD
ncbi:FAD-dependent oxidoreductase [Streptomyces sp. NPDC059866]|uniref:FAD-dependent oxidoreductase n=1 Tax=Streptomyces sp. NPDC059866 TaxID=3346978 RepID=UPI00365B2ED0